MKARVHGDFVIKNTEEKEYAFYVIRKLTVSLKEVTTKYIIIRDTGAIVELGNMYAVRAIKEKLHAFLQLFR